VKISTLAKTIRATTAIVLFGIPLAAGTAALIGCGVAKAAKYLKNHKESITH
jgi:hypothetical protein